MATGHGHDTVIRHNKLRDIIADLCRKAHLSVRVEAGHGLCRDNNHFRPADILVEGWERGQPAALDTTVTSPLTPVSLKESSRFAAIHLSYPKSRVLADIYIYGRLNICLWLEQLNLLTLPLPISSVQEYQLDGYVFCLSQVHNLLQAVPPDALDGKNWGLAGDQDNVDRKPKDVSIPSHHFNAVWNSSGSR
eukprot:Em0003g754a